MFLNLQLQWFCLFIVDDVNEHLMMKRIMSYCMNMDECIWCRNMEQNMVFKASVQGSIYHILSGGSADSAQSHTVSERKRTNRLKCSFWLTLYILFFITTAYRVSMYLVKS